MQKDVNELKNFQFETTNDMKEKPSLQFVSSSLGKLKDNIQLTAANLKKAEQELSKQITLNERMTQQLKSDLGHVKKEMDKKIGKNEEYKIYQYFKRFAEYGDFKTLYNKCVPAIKGFEEKLMGFDEQNQKTMAIIS